MATVELVVARHVEHRAVECLPGPLDAPYAEVDIAREDDHIRIPHLGYEGGELVVQVGEGVYSHREYLLQWMPTSVCKICTLLAEPHYCDLAQHSWRRV
ncbi:hypothetical protein D3C78_687130 [compost metagenome]